MELMIEREADERDRADRAALIRAERMPKRPVVKAPTWGEVVQSHLRLERRLGIRGRASCSP